MTREEAEKKVASLGYAWRPRLKVWMCKGRPTVWFNDEGASVSSYFGEYSPCWHFPLSICTDDILEELCKPIPK